MAAKALRADEPGLGSGGLPHHGHDLRRPRTGLEVHGLVGLRRHRQKRLWARTGLVGVGRRLGKLDGGGMGVGLWREVQGWACPGLVLWRLHDRSLSIRLSISLFLSSINNF